LRWQKAALPPQKTGSALYPHPEEPDVALAKPGVSKDEAEKGIATMSRKSNAMGEQVFIDAEKAKESNRWL
jgi:hypothetical protein